MKTDPRPGSEPAATYGGSGWRAREGTHAGDVGEGRIWRRCGYTAEYTRLRDVVLAWPPDSIEKAVPPNAWLFTDRVDLAVLRCQTESIASFYRTKGVTVELVEPESGASPNVIFQRDCYFATCEGAILARMASQQRAGEERLAARALAAIGIPILRTLRGRATFEGADALWLDPKSVLIGVGMRTNPEGFEQVAATLSDQGVRSTAFPLPRGVQHLLGIMNPLDRDLVAVDAGRAPAELLSLLADRGMQALAFDSRDEVARRRSLNFVVLGPREVVMPAGCPESRACLESSGVTCHELEVGEYVKAAGALGCLTGILRRDP